MRKPKISALPLITIVFAAFTIGFFLGRSQNGNDLAVSVPGEFMTVPVSQPNSPTEPTEETTGISFPISINQAGKEELMALPGIGEVLAERILDFREENGDFDSPEELLNVEGVGKKRLEEILDLITVGG